MLFNSGFYKAGNFVAAINAFTAAIVLDDSIPSYPLIPHCFLFFVGGGGGGGGGEVTAHHLANTHS